MALNIRGTALVLLLLPVAAPAQTPAAAPASPEHAEARAKVRVACAADIQKFCPTIERGKGETRACLQAHATEISEGCRTARGERAAARSKSKD